MSSPPSLEFAFIFGSLCPVTAKISSHPILLSLFWSKIFKSLLKSPNFLFAASVLDNADADSDPDAGVATALAASLPAGRSLSALAPVAPEAPVDPVDPVALLFLFSNTIGGARHAIPFRWAGRRKVCGNVVGFHALAVGRSDAALLHVLFAGAPERDTMLGAILTIFDRLLERSAYLLHHQWHLAPRRASRCLFRIAEGPFGSS